MDYILIGNSISRQIQPEGFTKTLSLSGANLSEILRVAYNTPGVRVLLCGIPDIAKKYHEYTTASMVSILYKKIEEFENLPGQAILLPFYPTGYLAQSEWSIVESINERIKKANRKRQEVTPNVLEGTFRGLGRRPYLNRRRLMDDVHPTPELCRHYESTLSKWRLNREAKMKEASPSTPQQKLEKLIDDRKKLDIEIHSTQRRVSYEAEKQQLLQKHRAELEALERKLLADLEDIKKGILPATTTSTNPSESDMEAERLLDEV
jgi:hypothetical protein